MFRLLVCEGPAGLPAGKVATQVGVQPATLSFHLAQLERAGLLVSRRRSRQILYAADFAAMRGLIAFLLDELTKNGILDVGLAVTATNERAMKLYASFGFEVRRHIMQRLVKPGRIV